MDRQQSLSKIAKELMLKEPFYGFFLINLNKVWDARKVPTAGVSKNNINYQLAINPEFWESLSDDHKLGLLKHELDDESFIEHCKNFDSYRTNNDSTTYDNLYFRYSYDYPVNMYLNTSIY